MNTIQTYLEDFFVQIARQKPHYVPEKWQKVVDQTEQYIFFE